MPGEAGPRGPPGPPGDPVHVDSNCSVVSDRSLSSVCNTDFTDLTLRVDDVTETTVNASMISVTRGSAIAEEPRDALRQFFD